MTEDTARARTRAAIIEVAARLLTEGGSQAVTTRAVAAEAGIQAPTIYRIFGDKDGLLDAVAEHVAAGYIASKAKTAKTADPLADLRTGWDSHIEFSLANPALTVLLSDPGRRHRSPNAVAGEEVLRERIHRIAATGRLRVSEDRAMRLIQAAGTGVVLTLLSESAESRDPALAATVYAAVLRTIVTDAPDVPADGVTAAAVTLRSGLAELPTLSPGERALMGELLDRVIASGNSDALSSGA